MEDDLPPPASALGPLAKGLDDPDPATRIRSADAIALAAEEGMPLPAVIPAIAAHLGDSPEVAESAARALHVLFLKGGNLAGILPQLASALASRVPSVRAVASRVVSRYKVLRGEEVPLKPAATFKLPPAKGAATWTAVPSHRRTYAAGDDPVRGETVRPCAACNSPDTACIYVTHGPATVSLGAEYEYQCRQCGKYTLYTYEE